MGDMITNLFHGEGNPRNSEGAFVKLKNGDILFVYTRYKSDSWEDAAAADLVSRISKDGGRTWGDWNTVVQGTRQNVMSVSLLRLQDGRIAMAYAEKSRKERQLLDASADDSDVLDCRPWICFSSDEGATWSASRDVTRLPPSYIVVNNDRLVQLSGGRLILPIAFHHLTGKKGSFGESIHPRAESYFYLSDDGGASWREAQQCCYPPQGMISGLREPGVVELADGRIMAWFRTDSGMQYKSFSVDGGETWSTPEPAFEFPSQESPLSMKRNPATGELFAVWSDIDPRWGVTPTPESWQRTPLVMARSTDEGKSWHGHRVLEKEPDHGYCYIAMLFDDNALLLAYCCGGAKDSIVLQDLRIRRIEM